MARPTFKIQAELSGFLGGWTTLLDVVMGSTTFDRGLPGTKSTDFVAKTGILQFILDNSQYNSQDKLGLYTPGHANAMTGWAKNIGIRCLVTIDGTDYVQFTGRLLNIVPTTGVTGERRAYCTVVDYMDQFARKRLVDLPLQVDASDDAVFQLIIDAMPVQPRAVRIDTGFDTLQYAFDTMKAERAVPTTEILRLCKSTLRRCYIGKDGTVVFESRTERALNTATNVIELTPADYLPDNGPDIEDNRDTVVNRVQATLHPRKTGVTADVVLFELEGTPFIQANYPFSVRGFYTEPGNLARRAGGLDMLPAVANTDYSFNTLADGSGADVTSSVTVTTIYTANSVLFQIESTVNCYCVRLQARGTAVTDQGNVITETTDADSIEEFGENSISLDMPYSGDSEFGNEVVQYLLFLEQQTSKRVLSVPLLLNDKSIARQQLIVQREISDRVGVTEPMNALPVSSTSGHFINAISMHDDEEGNIFVDWTLTLADSTQYWYLEIPGFSELGFTTRLGFGLVVGHTDVAHSDSHSDSVHEDTAHIDSHGDVSHDDVAHGDSAHGDSHSDVAHGDSAHVDAAHSDGHSDSGHSDSAHDDAHSDSAYRDTHTDVAHVDTPHTDVAFQGYTNSHDDNHGDSHGDTAHTDNHGDSHSDYGGDEHTDEHTDTHDDVAHDDSHDDASWGSHIDDGGHPHEDVAHLDGAHTDSHTDDAHGDTHGDTAHGDSAHGDSHSDVAHTDVSHTDSHTDSHVDGGHVDAGHSDTPHNDTHIDVSHVDNAHGDSHGDTAHGDAN